MSRHHRNNNTDTPSPAPAERTGWRRHVENIATFGLLLVCAALVIPLVDIFNPAWQRAMKWVYASGALIFIVARAADLNVKGESFRLRRLRRMEFWAGIAFGIAAFFWFYNAHRLGDSMGMTLGVIRDTILFTMVGAALQVIASWMIASRLRKEQDGSR